VRVFESLGEYLYERFSEAGDEGLYPSEVFSELREGVRSGELVFRNFRASSYKTFVRYLYLYRRKGFLEPVPETRRARADLVFYDGSPAYARKWRITPEGAAASPLDWRYSSVLNDVYPEWGTTSERRREANRRSRERRRTGRPRGRPRKAGA